MLFRSQIFHIRTSDDTFFNSANRLTLEYFNHKYSQEVKILKENVESNDFIITNNTEFKTGLAEYYPQYTISKLDTCHIGLPNLNHKAIRDTLVEFFIMTKSSKIKTYSHYDWISGYANRVADIYDIPINNLREKNENNILS